MTNKHIGRSLESLFEELGELEEVKKMAEEKANFLIRLSKLKNVEISADGYVARYSVEVFVRIGTTNKSRHYHCLKNLDLARGYIRGIITGLYLNDNSESYTSISIEENI